MESRLNTEADNTCQRDSDSEYVSETAISSSSLSGMEKSCFKFSPPYQKYQNCFVKLTRISEDTIQSLMRCDSQSTGLKMADCSASSKSDNSSKETKNKNALSSKSKNYSKKKEFCCYCKQLRTNIARHYEIVHFNEEKVVEFLNYAKKSAERAKLITELRRAGNFEYKVNTNNRLILVRRRHVYHNPRNAKDYFLACPVCKGFFSKKYIAVHHRSCSSEPNKKGSVRSIIRDSRSLTENVHPAANDILKRKILPPMRRDNIFKTVIKDKLLILFGNYFTSKYIGHQEYIIRQRLRLLGRFFLAVKNIGGKRSNLSSFAELLECRHFEMCMSGIDRLAGLSSETGMYATPKIALEMVHYLKLCCKVLESSCIKEAKKAKQKEVKNFLKLLCTETPSRINKPAHRDLVAYGRQNRAKIMRKLPITDDINKFQKYLIRNAQIIYDFLMSTFEFEKWKQLMEMTLLYLAVYNRKRSGEIHRITIQDYENISALAASTLPETMQLLNPSDKAQAQATYKIVIRGKLNKTVCAFVTQRIKKFLDYIIEHRKDAGVPQNNPYLFGLPGKLSGFRYKILETCEIMRKYTMKAGLKNPRSIRTTLLRHHLATTVSALELKDSQQDTVMEFMGHTEKVHKGFYREQVVTKDLLLKRILEKSINTLNAEASATCSESVDEINEPTETNDSYVGDKDERQKCGTAELTDTDNEYIYNRNLSILKNTPKKTKEKAERPNDYSHVELEDANGVQNTPEKAKPIRVRLKRRRLFSPSQVNSPESEDSESSQNELTGSRRQLWTSKEKEAALNAFNTDLILNKIPSISQIKKTVKNITALKGRTAIQIKSWLIFYLKRKASPPKLRQRWMTPEKFKVQELFGEYIKDGKYPTQSELYSAIERYPELQNRSAEGIRSYLQYAIKKMSS